MKSSKSNILFLVHTNSTKGDGQKNLFTLLKNLDRKVYAIHVVVPETGNLVHMFKELDISVSVVSMGRISPFRIFSVFSSLFRLNRFLKKHSIKIIQTDNRRGTLHGGLAAYFLRIPVVWKVHTGSEGWGDKILAFLCTRIILVNSGLRKRFEWLDDNDRFAVIPGETPTEKSCHETEQMYAGLLTSGGKEFGDTRTFSNSKLLFLGVTKFLYWIVYGLAKGKRGESFDPARCKTILVLSLDRIGDLVLALPVFANLRKNFPTTKIVALSNSYAKDILYENRAVDELIIYDSGRYKGLMGKISLIREIRNKKIDLLIDLSCDNRINTALLSSFFKPGYSVGYNTNYRGGLFHKAVWPPKKIVHQTEVYLELLRAIGLPCPITLPLMEISESRKQNGRKAIEAKLDAPVFHEKILLGVCPGGFYATQRWPEERFAKVCHILGKTGKVVSVLLGGPKDMKSVDEIVEGMETDVIVLAGNYSLKESVNILSQCSVVFANNSGLLHIAAALGIPTVSTMGPTVPERWWPVGDNHTVLHKQVSCRPCNRGVCDTHECLQDIEVEEVVKAVQETIRKSVSGGRDQ